MPRSSRASVVRSTFSTNSTACCHKKKINLEGDLPRIYSEKIGIQISFIAKTVRGKQRRLHRSPHYTPTKVTAKAHFAVHVRHCQVKMKPSGMRPGEIDRPFPS